MVFGAKIPNANKEVQILRSFYRADDISPDVWKKKWGWFMDEHLRLRQGLERFVLPPVEATRTAKPYPPTENGQYGWLAVKPDFRLAKFGPDLPQPKELPKMYKLLTNLPKSN